MREREGVAGGGRQTSNRGILVSVARFGYLSDYSSKNVIFILLVFFLVLLVTFLIFSLEALLTDVHRSYAARNYIIVAREKHNYS